MHLTTIFLFLTVFVFSVSALDSNTTIANTTIANTGGATGGDAQACSKCWVTTRNGMNSCQNIPTSEVANMANLTDESLGADSHNYPSLVSCLCNLANQVDTIIASCPMCAGDISQGLKTEALIVASKVCGSDKALTNTTSSNSTADSSAGTTTTTTTTTLPGEGNGGSNSDPSVNVAQSSDALSIAPWSKSMFTLAIAFVATWLY